MGIVDRHGTRTRMKVRPTGGGMQLLVASAVTGVLALQPGGNVLIIVLGLFLSALVVNIGAGWWGLSRLQVERLAMEGVVAGEGYTVRYRVRNGRRRGRCFGVWVRESVLEESTGERRELEGYVAVVAGGRSVVVTVPVVWSARGRVRFERITVWSTFPFGLVRKAVSFETAAELVVYPRLGQLRTSVWHVVRRAEAVGSGEGTSGTSGGEEEFYGLRDYRPGDNPRRIHWRRSARTGRLFVREMSRPRVRQMWCVVDTYDGVGGEEGRRRLERCLSCAATVVCDVLERGGKVGLLVNGSPSLVSPPGSGRALRGLLLRELALRTANEVEDLAACVSRISWPTRWRGPCLVLTPAVTEAVRTASGRLERMVGAVTVMSAESGAMEGFFEERSGSGPTWEPVELVSASEGMWGVEWE